MEHLCIFLSAVSVLLSTSLVATTPSGETDESNAQANPIGSSEASSGVNDDSYVLVRRYIPRFVGKREPTQAELEHKDSDTLTNTLDKDKSLRDFVGDLLEYYDYLENNDLGSSVDDENVDIYVDEHDSDDDNEDVETSTNTQEEKRYIPSFVGKRKYTPMFVGKRYRPMFVGKRYQPRFVGKRYQPQFVGKRYQPQFVGKRYQPQFVGKRYQPQFVGKRYQPQFVGKRYQPQFVGKRYQPQFVGKRYQPQFVGKRYQPQFVGKRDETSDTSPLFIGKRYQPQFVGKRYQPRFVGKRYQPRFVGKRYQPQFVGKREEDTESSSLLADKRYKPMFVGKRSSLEENNVEESHIEKRSVDSDDNNAVDSDDSHVVKSRRKRSVFIGMDPLEKRFVAPEFIGRRDSLTSILSALDALQYARETARPTTKRFEAPLFIGKRMRPLFVGKRSMDGVNEMSSEKAYEVSPRQFENIMGAYERLSEDYTPSEDMLLAYSGFPYESGKL